MKKDELEKHLVAIHDMGLIETKQLNAIQEQYVNKIQIPSLMDRSFVIFGLLGVVFAGVGTILLFAFNWSSFSVSLQTFIAVMPFVSLQMLLYIKLKQKASYLWIELLSLGLGIALVACVILLYNTYQLDYPYDFFIVGCMLLLTPLVYVLNLYYLPIGIFAGYFYCWSSFSYELLFDQFLIGLVIFIPHYILRRKKKEAFVVYSFLLATWVLLLPNVLDLQLEMYILLFGILIFSLVRFDVYVQYVSRILAYALLLFFSITANQGYIFLSVDVTPELWFVIGATILCYVFFLKKHTLKKLDYIILALFTGVCTLGFILSATSLVNSAVEVLYAFMFKGLFLSLTVLKILQALKTSHTARVTRYLLALSAYGFFEAISSDLSLVTKGVFLILIGIGFFVANYIFSKRIKNET